MDRLLAFSFEVMSIYMKTIGSLLNSSLFFLVTGLVVSGLAAMAYRLHARGSVQEARS